MHRHFGHEKLKVYQEALRFINWVEANTNHIAKTLAAKKHLDEASTSIVLNIAEGNGKYTNKDKCKYFDIAKGSTAECAGCLDILNAKGFKLDLDEGKNILRSIYSMLIGLNKSTSENRIYEDITEYKSEK
jgi:four helix bundle protein